MESNILKGPIEVRNALTELGRGLSVEVLREAIQAGEMERDACTPNDPLSAPGFFSYSRTTRALAESLIPLGWTREDLDGLALVVSPTKENSIVVSTGDDGTGVEYLPVRSKYPKGPATVTAVANNRQMTLFPEMLREQTRLIPSWTWLLLRRRAGDRLYSEMSLPFEVGEDGRVESWVRRLILEPMLFEPNVGDDGGSEPPIVIDIPRR